MRTPPCSISPQSSASLTMLLLIPGARCYVVGGLVGANVVGGSVGGLVGGDVVAHFYFHRAYRGTASSGSGRASVSRARPFRPEAFPTTTACPCTPMAPGPRSRCSWLGLESPLSHVHSVSMPFMLIACWVGVCNIIYPPTCLVSIHVAMTTRRPTPSST